MGESRGSGHGADGVSGRRLSAAEIQARLPLWDAIADLFLDTEIDDGVRAYVARVLAPSPFSLDELDAIYRFEVAPVVHANLKVVAGEWAGFGEEWLGERIPAHLARSGRWSRRWAGSRLGRWWRTSATDPDWQAVLRLVAELRRS